MTVMLPGKAVSRGRYAVRAVAAALIILLFSLWMVSRHTGTLSSEPTVYAEVKRADQITVAALDRHGKPFELVADGLLAVCIQHEHDHLIGKIFVDYLSPLKRSFAIRKLERAKRERIAEKAARDRIAKDLEKKQAQAAG